MSKLNLADALNKVASTPKPTTKPRAESAEKPKAKAEKTSKTPASREGKKPLIAYVDPAAVRELKILSAKLDSTQQDLLVEALNDLFVKHGMKPIA